MVRFQFIKMLAMVAIASSASTNEVMQELSVLEKTGEYQEDALKLAGQWFRIHQDPQGDAGDQAGMTELKKSNPEAWAVVNALLTKKSLGLLNSRHPTASMGGSGVSDAPLASLVPISDAPVSSPQAPVTAPSAPVAVPQVALTAPVATPAVAAPDLDVPGAAEWVDSPSLSAPKHHDFLHWKPANDEAMVSQVLGMAASLSHGGSAAEASEAPVAPEKDVQPTAIKFDPPAQPQVVQAINVEDAPAQPQFQLESQPKVQPEAKAHPQSQPQHRDLFDWGNTYADQTNSASHQAVLVSPARPAVKVHQDLSSNPYLKGIDFSSELGTSTMSQVAENSYLKSVDMDGSDVPKAEAKRPITAKDIGGGPNKLTGFSWYN